MKIEILTNNGVDVNKGIELLGDIEMYNETLDDFLEEEKTRVPNIIKYYQEMILIIMKYLFMLKK